MIELPAVVKSAFYTGGFPGPSETTIIHLVPPEDFDYRGAGIQWPVTLFLPGDVTPQHQPGVQYKIKLERVT